MSYKESTNKVLLDFYRKNDLAQTIKVAHEMLRASTHKDNKVFHSHVHGEICETVLEAIILEYMKLHPAQTKEWFFSKGLIVKDVHNPNSGYFTEIDLIVFTPQKLIAFECKSYGGNKKITDKCTIKKAKGGQFDVYDQHEKHARVLSEQLNPFRKREFREKPAYQLVLFDFAEGETKDVRGTKEKLLMPCLNENNVMNVFRVIRDEPVIWNMPQLKRAIEIIERQGKENTAKHLEYVKGLKH